MLVGMALVVYFSYYPELQAATHRTMAMSLGDEFTYGTFDAQPVKWVLVYKDEQTNHGVALAKDRLKHSFWNTQCKANGAAYCETLGKNAYFQGEAGLWMDQFVPSISSSFASDTSPIAQEINQLNLSNLSNLHSADNPYIYLLPATAAEGTSLFGYPTWIDYQTILANADVNARAALGYGGSYNWWLSTRAGGSYGAFGACVNPSGGGLDYCGVINDTATYVIRPALYFAVPLNKLSIEYAPVYGNGLNKYEHLKNTKVNDAIGTVVFKDYEVPISLSLKSSASAPSGHENDYLNFSIVSSSNDSSEQIYVSGSAPALRNNALKVQDYYFTIEAVDASGNKDTIDVQLSVEPTVSSVSFDQASVTKKLISEAQAKWIEHATTSPPQAMQVTYAISGGNISLIDIDPRTGEITYKGNGAYGMVKIKATADDDPSTGEDNYQSSFAEKEIMIVRQVEGIVTPDSASSDMNTPTFSMNQANIKTNGNIGVIKGTLGTPDVSGGNTITYAYAIKAGGDGNYFKVNESTGVIQSVADLAVGSYHFTIEVSDKWSTKEIHVTVNVGMAPAENLKFYENSTSNTMITSKSATLTDTNVSVFATVKGSSNTNPVTYRIKDGSTNVITVHPNSGAITINGVGSVIIVAEKTGNTGQANAITELTFTVTAGSQQFIYTDASGNELPKSGNDYDDYSEVYGQGKTFQLYTAGNPAGTNVTYALKAGSPTDVISVDPSGLVSILNASLNTQIGQVIVEATSHDPSGNYSDKTIELSIVITKANQTISFSGVTSAQNGRGTVTPIITEQDISSNDGGVSISDTNYYISVDASASGIAWTNNGVDIDYNYTGNTTIEIPLEVTKAGNRNYNSATAKGKMKILSPSESTLSISQPGKIYYGDHFTIRSLQDDSSSTNVKYTFTVDNTIFVSNPTVNGNSADFDALKCSSGTKINITVTRTADSEVTLSKVVTIEVLPKDINVIIDDKTKQKGEPNPPLTFQDFRSQLVSWNGVQDVVDLNDVKLSTSATTNSKSGSYPITGNPKTMNTTYPNYNFIFKEGKLMIDSQVDKDVDGDGKPDFNDPDGDDCPDLNIKWKDDNGNWIVINGDRDYDGIPDLNIDSDGDGVPDLNIDTDNDGKPDINLVILKKTDWKPTKCVTVSSTVKEEYCTGTKVKPQINLDTDNDNIPNINIDTDGDMKADINIASGNNKPSINIVEITNWISDKDYTVNKFLYDTMINIAPVLNVDTNGDGCPDLNIDLDNDGVADLNIDTDDDQIPNVEIDTTGDGNANANIDTNNDGEPEENIIEINSWEPNQKTGNICTMVIKQNTELEDNGIKVEKPDGTPFLPNYALKVEEVTDSKKEEIANDAKDFIKETNEVKKVYDVKLYKDDVEVQPDGTLKVKIPYEGIKNPILLRKNAKGTYERIEFQIEGNYLTYETDELGIVSIIGDKESNTSVMGSYTPNIGGAITGDETNTNIYIGISFITLGMISYLLFKRSKQKDTFQ